MHSCVPILPFTFVGDPSDMSASDGFGRVKDMDSGSGASLRRVVGALVEGVYRPTDGQVFLRGKLASVEYDRDKGIWDWRALDAEVGIKHVRKLANGRYPLTLVASAGADVGGIHLNDFESLQKALNIAPTMENAITLNPHAILGAGISSSKFKVELVTRAEQRIDLTPDRAKYLGREIDVNSQRIVTNLSADYFLPRETSAASTARGGGRRFSLFGGVQHDFDSLTLPNVMFCNGDAFNAITILGGVRGRF